MPGKALVRRNHVPLWDAEVQAVLTDVASWTRRRETPPQTHYAVLADAESRLHRLVDTLDSGLWIEGTLAPTNDDQTVVRPKLHL